MKLNETKMEGKMRVLKCRSKWCCSCRDGYCHDITMIRLANFGGKDKDGLCFNWSPSKKNKTYIIEKSFSEVMGEEGEE